MDVPQTQRTAPVLEFRCMYTSDLRRKQKRWQDGRLRFHTFNKRAMVYDERSNFVGDTHWRNDYEFDEGEELELERGGILIEVGECIGRREQDLSELLDKRVKEREERVAAKNAKSPLGHQTSHIKPQTRAGTAHLRPKSLIAVIGDPTGHYGRAVISNLSPFEQKRISHRNEIDDGKPAKRQKQNEAPSNKNGYAQNLMGATLTLASSKPPSTATIQYEPLRASIQRPYIKTIDLTADEDQEKTTSGRKKLREQGTAPTKIQRQRPNKCPTSRTGYASTLTGASLTLSGPEVLSSRSVDKRLDFGEKKYAQASRQVDPDSSSTLDQARYLDMESIQEQQDWTVKSDELRKKTTRSSILSPANPFCISPSPVTGQPTILSKATENLNSKVNQNLPAARLIVDQYTSALRIKARPPRKMMMLMERPRPAFCSAARTAFSNEIPFTSQRVQNGKHISQDVILSQATVRLNSFCEKQQELLQVRLNGKRAENYLKELPSSPSESEINHTMNENPFSSNAKPTEKAAPTTGHKPAADSKMAIEDERITHLKNPSRFVNSINTVVAGDTLALIASKPPSESNTLTGVEPDNLESNVPGTGRNKTIVMQSDDLIVESRRKPFLKGLRSDNCPDEEMHLDFPCPSVNEMEKSSQCERSERMVSEVRITEEVQHLLGQRMSPKPSSPARIIETLSPQCHPPVRNAYVVGGQQPDLTVNFAHESVDHYAIARLPGTRLVEVDTSISNISQDAWQKASLPVTRPSATRSATATTCEPNLPRQHILGPPDLGSVSIIKASPKSSPALILQVSGSQDRNMVAFATRMDSNNASENPIRTLPTVPNARISHVLKRKVEPLSTVIQITANRTGDSSGPTFNIGSRTATTLSPENAGPSRSRNGPLKAVTAGGPWSRESFDLFGTWRPPGRDPGADATL